jgi:hypothetical protein
MWGHDDRICRAEGRIYLECAECGRETGGWHLKSDATEPPNPRSRSWAHVWRRDFWSQAWRDPFAAIGLR